MSVDGGRPEVAGGVQNDAIDPIETWGLTRKLVPICGLVARSQSARLQVLHEAKSLGDT